MKKKLKRALLVVTILFLLIFAYYAWALYSARTYTIETILPREKAARYALDLSSLSAQQLDILLKVEDPNFFKHGGVDFSTPGAGITTITQALVKHLYFKRFEPGIAKIEQTLIAAFVFDPLMPKEQQLRLFINSVYLGQGVNGFQQAADVYFHKPFAKLTEDEYIALVAMSIAPDTFSITRFPDRNKERVKRIKRLVSGEYKPRGLCDVYYGPLDEETQKNLAPLSYFKNYYE